MSRELIEAAKAVIADRDENGSLTTVRGIQARHDAWRPFVAAVRAAEAAPVADAERVREAANAAIRAIPGHGGVNAFNEWVVRLVADAIRPYITPAPVADTVAVPVKALLVAVDRLNSMYRRSGEEIDAAIHNSLVSLLPTPAPEPSAELVAEWKREAKEYADKCCAEHESVTHDEYVGIQTGYVARARAEWAKKGGG